MANKICLDTDVMINLLRNKKDTVEWIKKAEKYNILATTTVNLFELYFGAYKSKAKEKNLKAVKELEDSLIILNLSQEIVRKAGEKAAILQEAGNSIDFRDLLIGVISLNENYKLKTNNKKHFSKLKELVLE